MLLEGRIETVLVNVGFGTAKYIAYSTNELLFIRALVRRSDQALRLC